MAKAVIIQESQYKKLFEARMDGFRLDNLRNMNFRGRIKYLNSTLGQPIGKGSSRWVYQVDDYTVLKLAINEKGIAQNECEYRLLKDDFLSIIPKVFNGSDEENFQWIITEYVLPAKKSDFKKLVGVYFPLIADFCSKTDISRGNSPGSQQAYHELMKMYDKYEENEALIELFNDIASYAADYDRPVGDLTRIVNWGLANRKYGPELVILDAGLSYDVFDKYYGGRNV